ncbi:MAG: hypothetical protein QXY90_04700 [Candidatus Anstonellales archaeon]
MTEQLRTLEPPYCPIKDEEFYPDFCLDEVVDKGATKLVKCPAGKTVEVKPRYKPNKAFHKEIGGIFTSANFAKCWLTPSKSGVPDKIFLSGCKLFKQLLPK